MVFLIIAVVFMVLMIIMVATSKGKPSDSFRREAKPGRFTQPVEDYRLSVHLTQRAEGEELSGICAEYRLHGYELIERSGRDSLDLTFRKEK